MRFLRGPKESILLLSVQCRLLRRLMRLPKSFFTRTRGSTTLRKRRRLCPMVGVQRSLHGHHAAANIHADRRRNDRPAGGNHAADSHSDAPMHIRHGRHPLVDERQLLNVQELLARSILHRDALGPSLDRHTLIGHHQVVSCVGHRIFLSYLNSRSYASLHYGGSARSRTVSTGFYSPHSPLEFPSQIWWTVRDSNSHCTVAGRR